MQDCHLPLPYNTFKVYWGHCQESMTWEMAGSQHSYEVVMLTTEHQNQSCGGDDTPHDLRTGQEEPQVDCDVLLTNSEPVF